MTTQNATRGRTRYPGTIDPKLTNGITRTNLAAWWDFAYLGGLLNNTDPIASVNDFSGLGHGLSQTVAANKLLLEKPGLNGMSVGLWDTTPNDYFNIDGGGLSLGTTHTMAIVIKTSTVWNATLLGQDGTNYGGYIYDASNYYERHSTEINVLHALTTNNWYTLVCTRNGTAYSYYKNGGSAVNATGIGTSSFTPIFFGARTAGAITPSGMRVAEVLIWNVVLGSSDISNAQAYLRKKWNHY